jgi:hypothetical protein
MQLAETKRPRALLTELRVALAGKRADTLDDFDERLVASAGPEAAFALICDLRGLTRTADATAIAWFAKNIQRIVQVGMAHARDSAIVRALGGLWGKLLVAKMKNEGFAIRVFRAALPIVAIAREGGHVKAGLALLRRCLASGRVTFGIMEYYGDETFARMCDSFYLFLAEAGELDWKSLVNVLHTFVAIPDVTKLKFFESPEKVMALAAFIANVIKTGTGEHAGPLYRIAALVVQRVPALASLSPDSAPFLKDIGSYF